MAVELSQLILKTEWLCFFSLKLKDKHISFPIFVYSSIYFFIISYIFWSHLLPIILSSPPTAYKPLLCPNQFSYFHVPSIFFSDPLDLIRATSMSTSMRLFLGMQKLTRGQTIKAKQLPLPLQSLAANRSSGRSGPSDFLPIHATLLRGIILCRYSCSLLMRATAMHSPEPKKYSFLRSSFYVSSALFLCCFLAFTGLIQMSH